MFKVGEKVWVKPSWVLAQTADKIDELGNYFWEGLAYYMSAGMFGACGGKFTVKTVSLDKNGCPVYVLESDDWGAPPPWWEESWLTNKDPERFPEQFDDDGAESKNDSPLSDSFFVSDFDGTKEELSDAEKYFELILPELKKIIIDAFNEGAKL